MMIPLDYSNENNRRQDSTMIFDFQFSIFNRKIRDPVSNNILIPSMLRIYIYKINLTQ